MQKILLGCTLALVALMSVSADAATVYFRGQIQSLTGSDTLGLTTLPSPFFESLVTTDGSNNILGSYIVFQGVSYNINGGTLGAGPFSTNLFSNMNLTTYKGAPAGVLNFSVAGPVVSDNQPGLDSLIGRSGTFSIAFGGSTYSGAITAVPEPASLLALSGLVLGCGGYTWRKRRAAKQAA